MTGIKPLVLEATALLTEPQITAPNLMFEIALTFF